jgi:hypothetical protein
VTCPECMTAYRDGAAFCGFCGTQLARPAQDPHPAADPESAFFAMAGSGTRDLIAPDWPGGDFAGFDEMPGPYIGASASQFPRTPGDQYIPAAVAGHHSPPPAAPAREFRLDLRRLSRAEQVSGSASLIVLLSVFLPWFGFDELGADISISGTTAHSYLVIVVITALLLAGYLLLRAGWDEFPVSLPLAPELMLLAGASLQFALVLVGFADVPLSGLGWEIGAYLALIAATAAVAPLVSPALGIWPARR